MDDIRPTDEPDNLGHFLNADQTPAESGGRYSSPSAEELRKRLEEVERELAKTKAERDEYKASTYSLLEQIHPFVPPTDAEIHDMMYGPRGQPIIEIIEELEREIGAKK